MTSWERSFGGACSRATRLLLLALTLGGCGLYVSEREGFADGGAGSGGSSGAGPGGNSSTDDGGPLVDAGCHPQDEACGYRFKREVTFNPRILDEVLFDFPVLVSLDSERIDYGVTQPDGADLRFVDDDGRVLPHEIERWQPGGISTIWVRIPRVEPGVRKTISYYYGSATATAISSGPLVFSAGFEAVYHLSDDLTQGRVIRDALAEHDGQPSQGIGAIASVSGQVGGGLALRGGQTVALPGISSASETALTVELWIKTSSALAEFRLICRDGTTLASEPVACLGVQDDRAEMQITTMGEGGRFGSASGEREISDEFTHIALVLDGERQWVGTYVNGMQDFASPTMGKILSDSLMPWVLGDRSAPSAELLGIVDEVRISRVARSFYWLLATYSVVAQPELVTMYGPRQTL